MKPCEHDSREKYELLIGPLREKARELGYAVAVHGTLKRDIDLIAVPWTSEATDERTLAESLRLVAEEINGEAVMGWSMAGDAEFSLNGCPGTKPHGRLGWCFSLGGGPYIDLSVMPRIKGVSK
jgi:hypothetical protein